MSLTDARKMWTLLRDAGETGCHSHDLRRQGITGNPSQRAKDIASKGVAIWTAREPRNGRPGSRWWLAEHAPDWAVPVRPNNASETATVDGNAATRGSSDGQRPSGQERLQDKQEVAGSIPAPGSSQALHIAPAPPDYIGPVATVRDFDGSWAELPWDEENHRPLREAA